MNLIKGALIFVVLLSLSFSPFAVAYRGGPSLNLVENKYPVTVSDLSLPQETETPTNLAVLVGINDYAGTQNDLHYCVNDVNDVYSALVNVYGFSSNNIMVLTDTRATYANVLAALDWLAQYAGPNTTVVFYYSGHGSRSSSDPDRDGEKIDECIVTTELAFLWDGTLASKFRNINSSKIWLGFDSCYSGGMADAVQDDGLKGVARVNTMACKANQLCGESSTIQHGYFTYLLVDQGILGGKADSNGDGIVSIEEAFSYAQAHIKEYTRSQTPVISDGFAGDLIP
ncbi:MAG: caspase family protein [bacterium]